jgi:hypothetical protein
MSKHEPQETDMMSPLRVLAALCAALLLTVAPNTRAAEPKSPDAVKNALRMLAYVQQDMASKLPGKAYARLPHESQEFTEASAAMRDAVATDPPELRAQVEGALNKALKASNTVAEVSKSNDDARITAAVAAVDAALKELDALFPAGLRPVPGQLGGRPNGPPPGLR